MAEEERADPASALVLDEGKLVVCSHGCAKKGSMSAAEIDRAKDWKRHYRRIAMQSD